MILRHRPGLRPQRFVSLVRAGAVSSLLFLGIATFVRLCQTANESMMDAQRIQRIRHYYVELAPELAPYFVHGTHDDPPDVLEQMAIFVPERRGSIWRVWQRFLTISGAVGVVNSVLAGMFAGMLAKAGFGLSRHAAATRCRRPPKMQTSSAKPKPELVRTEQSMELAEAGRSPMSRKRDRDELTSR
jgi:hypothetical protein